MNFSSVLTNSTMLLVTTNSTDVIESFKMKPRSEVPSYQYGSQVTATTFFALIFLLGVFGNLLVILVVCMNRNMKTSVNIYLTNLCVADILVLTVCMPTVLVDVYAQDVWYFGKTMCYMVPLLENTVSHSSVLTLVAISAERYRVVCQPLQRMSDSIRKSVRVVALIWIISVLSNIPWLFIAEYRDSRQKDGTPIKVCRLPVSPPWRKSYVTFLCVLYFVVPFSVLLILYCRICYILKISKKETTSNELQNCCQSRRRQKLRAQVVNILTCLVLLFFVFHLPYRVISMWFTYANRFQIHRLGLHKIFDLIYSARILFYFNHAVNPILYNFVSTKFRNALKATIRGKRWLSSSTMSSNRRAQYNTPFTRPQHSQVLLVDGDDEHGILIQKNRSSSSTSSRQKMNEFYPMYASILQKHCQHRSVFNL